MGVDLPSLVMCCKILLPSGDILVELEEDPDPTCTFVLTAGDRIIAVDLLSSISAGCVVWLISGETTIAVLLLLPSLTNERIRILAKCVVATSTPTLFPLCVFVSAIGDKIMAVHLLSPIPVLGCVLGLIFGEIVIGVLLLLPSLPGERIRILPERVVAKKPVALFALLRDDDCSIGA